MSTKIKSRLLSLYLLLLIVLAIIQMGILWFDDLDEDFFSIAKQWFIMNDEKVSTTYTYENLFYPSTIFIAKGIDIPHYKMKYRSSDADFVWDQTKKYLRNVLTDQSIVKRNKFKYDEDFMNTLMFKKGFYIRLPFYLDDRTLSYLLNSSIDDEMIIEDFNALFLLPWENVNEDIITLYLCSDREIIQFEIELNASSEGKNSFEIIIQQHYDSNDVTYEKFEQVFPSKDVLSFEIDDRLLFSFDSDERKFVKYDSVFLDDIIGEIDNTDKEIFYQKMSRMILKDDIDKYIVSDDESHLIKLVNVNARYVYGTNHVLEYTNISKESDYQKPNLEHVFKLVLDQLEFFSDYITKENLYISNIYEDKDEYHFIFDYMIDGLPLYIHDSNINNLIHIRANENGILGYEVLAKKLIKQDDSYLYSVNFIDLLDKMVKAIGDEPDFVFKDYRMVYYMPDHTNEKNLVPKWKIYTKEGQVYLIDVLRKEY